MIKKYQTALNRLKTLEGHISMTPEAKNERSKSSFNLESAQEAIFDSLPQSYFDMLKCADDVNATDPTHHWDTIPEQKVEAQRAMVDTLNKMFELQYTTPQYISKNIDEFMLGATALSSVNNSSSIKYQVQLGLYCKAIRLLGTQKHYEDLIRGCSLQDIGAFCLTEIGHGSNINGIETTAKYDHELNGFIIHSPNRKSVKHWATNLGISANKAIVFANLIIKKKKYGIHAFLIPIRDEVNKPFPGLRIGELSTKKGHHGLDTGYVQLREYYVDKDCLLNRYCSINDNGEYSTKLDPKTGHMSIIQSIMIGARIALSNSSANSGLRAASIALRYGAVRRQFKASPGSDEAVLLDYTNHQYRLIPGFCENLIHMIGTSKLSQDWRDLGYNGVKELSVEDEDTLSA